MPAQTFQHYAIDTTSLACTLAIKEAVGVQGCGQEAQHGARQRQELDVAPSLPAGSHCAGTRHKERRHRLGLLTQDVEDLHTAALVSSLLRNRQ